MNTLDDSRCRIAGGIAIAVLAALGGCKEEPRQADGNGGVSERAPTVVSTLGPESSPVAIDMSLGWCGGHGVPESVCTRCDESLIDQFKAANDWCGGHDMPESQCILCNPEVEEKWEALAPRDDEAGFAEDKGSDAAGAMRLEPNRRLLTGGNDAQCRVDLLRVRFREGTIAEKAGIQTDAVRVRRLSSVIECSAEVDFDQTRLARVAPRAGGVMREAAKTAEGYVSWFSMSILDREWLGDPNAP